MEIKDISFLKKQIYWILLNQFEITLTGLKYPSKIDDNVDASHCIDNSCPCGGSNSHKSHMLETHKKLWQDVFMSDRYGIIDPAVRRSLEIYLDSDFPEWTLESFNYDSRLHVFRFSLVPK